MKNALSKFFGASLYDKWLYAEAAVWLLFGKAVVKMIPFRRIANMLGKKETESPEEAPAEELKRARRIGWRVRAVADRMPFNMNCFPQAIAGRMMLSTRGISSTTYFGLKNGENKKMEAHAWLRCGTVYVTGGDGSKEHAIVGRFS